MDSLSKLKKELDDLILDYESSIDSIKQQIKDVRDRLRNVESMIEIKKRLGVKAQSLPPKIQIEWNESANNFCVYFKKGNILNCSDNSLSKEHQRLNVTDYAWDLYDTYQKLFFDPLNEADIKAAELSYNFSETDIPDHPAPGFEINWRHRHDPFESHYELRFKADKNITWRPKLDSFEDDQIEYFRKKSWIIYDALRNFHF